MGIRQGRGGRNGGVAGRGGICHSCLSSKLESPGKMTREHNSGTWIEIDRMLLGCVDAGEADIHVVEGKVGVLSLHKKNLLSQCCNISKLTVRKKLFESNKLFGEDICVFISKMNAVEVTCMVSEYLLVHCKL